MQSPGGLQPDRPLPELAFKQLSRYDAPDGVCHDVQFGLVNIILPDDQRYGPALNRVDDGPEIVLLAVQDQARMGLGDDGDASAVVHHLDQRANPSAFEELFVGKPAFP